MIRCVNTELGKHNKNILVSNSYVKKKLNSFMYHSNARGEIKTSFCRVEPRSILHTSKVDFKD